MDVKQKISAIIASKKAAPLLNAPVDVVDSGEIISARTVNAKVFDAGNGMRRAKVYGVPIHWHDGKAFRAIDCAVKRKPVADARQTHQYEAKTGLYRAHFKADKPWDYRLEYGESWIEYEARFEESKSLTIAVETTLTGVKETITLVDADAPTLLSWKVSRSGAGIVTVPPTAVDAEGADVPVRVSESKGVLIYDVDVRGAVFPVTVDPTSSVTATNDGRVYNTNADYATARNATTGTGKVTTSITIGQTYAAGSSIYRGFISGYIPDMASIVSASLFLEGNQDLSTTNFDIYIHTSTYSDSLDIEDFDLFDGHQESGAYAGTVLNDTWNSSSYSATWNEIVFNASGLSAIFAKKNDILKLALISNEDYNNSEPVDSERITFESSYTVGKQPYLSITYEPPPIIFTGTAAATLSAALTAAVQLSFAGTAAASLSATAILARDVPLAGTAAAVLAATADLTRNKPLAGTADAVLAATADLTRNKPLAGTAAAALSAAASLSCDRNMAGTAAAVLAATLVISRDVGVAGSANARLSTYATLGIDGNHGLITGY